MAGVIATIPKFQFSANGSPMVGGTLQTFIAGTTTPAATWQDSALTISNTNPITLDARGECVLWLDETAIYKFVLKNALGVTQWTQDNVNSAAPLRTSLSGPDGAALVGANAYQTQDAINKENLTFKRFGAIGDGVADDTDAIVLALASATRLDGGGLTYKSSQPINIPPGTKVIDATFDLTALTTQTGFTTRVKSRFDNIRLVYAQGFSGIGCYLTTIDNGSSTSVSNVDSNIYTARNITVEKQMPTTGVAWDWYKAAAGIAVKWDGLDNPDAVITSGLWGALLESVVMKGLWLEAGVVADDGVAWITSSAWRHVIIDGPRRGIRIESAGGAAPKSGNLDFDDVHMQGWRWTKAGETDVVTEWMLNAVSTKYCQFTGFQPQDFHGAFNISDYIRFGANASRCYFQSTYITTDAAISNLGTGNWWDTLIGRSFANIIESANPRTMDYYLEGSFTPAFNGAGLTIGHSTQQGYFTRIGNRVNFNLYLIVNSLTGTPSGALTITGLPFAAASDANNFSACNVAYINTINTAAGYAQYGGYIGVGGASITLQYYSDNLAAASMQASDLSSASRIMVSGSYKV